MTNHSAEEWLNWMVYPNNIETVWSLLKRSTIGFYHKISIKHLEAFLDELEWRYNNRKCPWLFRDTLRKLVEADKVPYQELVVS